MRREIQIKTRHTLSPEELIALGGEWLGNVGSENIYLGGTDDNTTRRIRIEGNIYHYTEKGRNQGEIARVKEIIDREITSPEAHRLIKANGIIEKVEISSRIFALNGSVISLDEVTGLGQFLEVSAVDSEDDIIKILGVLGISLSECIKESYFDLMYSAKIPRWRKPIVRMHKRITEMTYGLTSGIMTSSGMLIGVYFAMPSKLAVASSMMALAVSDSLSEAYSMYNAKLAEGMSQRNAVRHGLYTMNGNVVIPVLFLMPIFLLPLTSAIYLNLSFSAAILICLSTLDSLATQRPIVKKASKTLALAILIVGLSTLAGKLVTKIFT